MKKIKIAITAVAIIAVGLLLNDIVTFLPSNRCKRTNESIETAMVQNNGDRGEAFIENGYNADTVGLEYVMNGGGFVETYEDNTDRCINILFENLENSRILYHVDTDLYSRPDIFSRLEDKYHLNDNYMYGFYTTFSPAAMKDGFYAAYIEVKENDVDQGLFYTENVYKKEGRTFIQQEFFAFLPKIAVLFGEEIGNTDFRAYATGVSVNNEMNFAWSSGWQTEMYLSACGHKEDMLCRVNVVSVITTPQHVTITSAKNGTILFEDDISEEGEISFRIPKECISKDGMIDLIFDYPNAIIPKEQGINEDPRRIAIAFNSVRLEKVG